MVGKEINDLAIIFEPYVEDDGMVTFSAVQVVEGDYDYDIDRFIDSNLYSYSHLTNCEKSKGFAFRESISQLSLKYPDKSLEEIKKILLKEHEDNIYFLGSYNDVIFIFRKDIETDDFVFVVDEDTKENLMCMYDDEEIKELMLKGIEEKKENTEEVVDVPEETEKKKISINPHLLYNQIKETVKGQDNAIKEIVTAIWENYNSDRANNLILVGPSGTGKTEILRQLAKMLDIPLLITAVTGMSQAGYVGTGTDEILSNLLTLTKGDVEKAEHAIIVLDEIDKLAFKGIYSGAISTDGVQNELLKIVEDGTFGVKFDIGHGDSVKVMLNTANITFIGVGAFNGMLTTKKSKGMGFNKDITEREEKKEKIVSEDLINFGLKPELVGRMGKIVKLNDLDLNIMKDIIKNSNKSAYISKIKFINKRGIKLDATLEDEIIEEIAKIAITKKIGARSITGIVNEMFSDILFDISNPDETYKELQISKETVTDSKKYILRK